MVVQGRVFEAGGAADIGNARVELEGHGATLTSAAGTFRFENVELGEYTLQVDALGYTSESRVLAVDGPTMVLVPLRIAPLPLDSLVIESRTIDIDGLVRYHETDLLLVNAELFTELIPGTLTLAAILSGQIPETRTDAHGRFTLDDVLDDVPLRVIVNAFGYLPVDTILLPDEDESYLFEPVVDPVLERMIEVQVGRIEERSDGYFTGGMRPMNQDRLLRYAGSHTLRDALEFEYGIARLRRVSCVLIDERVITMSLDPNRLRLQLSLDTMLPEEMERIEFLFGGEMLRIYTREFIRDMIARNIELLQPVMTSVICR